MNEDLMMSMLVLDKWVERRLRAQRKAWGGDRYDEVWEGVYVMSPLADNEHQSLIAGLTSAFQQAIADEGIGQVLPGANVSDREKGWKKNYRTPDVVVVLRGSSAKDCGPFWLGPVDFLVEIISRGDRSRRKLPFYSRLGVRELLMVDRKPWRLTLYRHNGDKLVPAGTCEIDDATTLSSEVVPFSFTLVSSGARPQIVLMRHSDGRRWQA